jgi:hypothetical protein
MPVLLDHTYTNLINDQEGDVQFRSSQTCKKFTLIHRIHKSSFQKTRMIADAVHFPTKKKKVQSNAQATTETPSGGGLFCYLTDAITS